MLRGIKAVFQRAWKDTNHLLGGWPTYIAIIVLPAIGLCLHFLLDGYAPMADEAHIWIIYMLAPLGLAFLGLFVVNLWDARFRIERDAHEVTKKKLEDASHGPQLPEIVYDTEWANGISMMPIHDVACALCGIQQDGFASSARARAIANDLVGAVSTGWVCSEDAHYHLMQKPIGGYSVVIAGKPKFPAMEEASINTSIYTPSLLADYVKNHKNLDADWIPTPEDKSRTVTIEAH